LPAVVGLAPGSGVGAQGAQATLDFSLVEPIDGALARQRCGPFGCHELHGACAVFTDVGKERKAITR
jgi:hypothetical protein